MDKDQRNRILRATQTSRALLELEFSEQLEGLYDIRPDGTVAELPGAHLDDAGRVLREKLVAAVDHHVVRGATTEAAVADFVREATFTCLNRLVALKLLEARTLLQECVSRGDHSSGFREFVGLAPGLAQLDDQGYRLYLESLFDEMGRDVGVLFDRRDPIALLWPRRQALSDLLETLNAPDLAEVWAQDETLGWVYQYFNTAEERKQMRDESSAPRNSRELAVRNQFFTPRYVVEFLVQNTLGRLWVELRRGETDLASAWDYFVSADELRERPAKDPRDIKILDPACGSGHFLLYSFDLLLAMYEEAFASNDAVSDTTGSSLRDDFKDLADLQRAAPQVIVERNLHGVEIDPRCGQIAALALWLRAQRAWNEAGIHASDRPEIRRTNIVVAEPIPADEELIRDFAEALDPPFLRDLFGLMVARTQLAGELGILLPIEGEITRELERAREQFERLQRSQAPFDGLEPPPSTGRLDFGGIGDATFFHRAEGVLVDALRNYADRTSGAAGVQRRLFSDDVSHGIALVDTALAQFDVVLMNPPFGAASLRAKGEFEAAYPRTKNDLYAAFVERGIQLLQPRGYLGAITSRTGFFLSSFQKWREEILLQEAPPTVFADLGYGVLDGAMVEVAAYCLEKTEGAS